MKKLNAKKNASKSFRLSINQAVQTLREMKNKPGKDFIVSVQPNVVIVKVRDVPKSCLINEGRRLYIRPADVVRPKVGTFVDQSVVDIERAVSTLEREPSKRVKDVYSQMAESIVN